MYNYRYLPVSFGKSKKIGFEIRKKSSPQFNSFNLIEYYLEERKHEYTTPTTVIP